MTQTRISWPARRRPRRLLVSSGFDGMVRLWDAHSGTCLRTLQVDRRYERRDITGLSGLTEAQRTALLALGAADCEPPLH